MKRSIVLCMPPPWTVKAPPLAPWLLRTVLRDRGYEASVFDLNLALYDAAPPVLQSLWDLGASDHWKQPGFFVRLLRDPCFAKVFERLAGCRADLLGFSLHSTSTMFTLELVRWLRDQGVTSAVVLGGPGVQRNVYPSAARFPLLCSNHKGSDPDTPLEALLEDLYSLVDILVSGEGEETLPAVVEVLGSSEAPAGAFFTARAGLAEFTARDPIADLDALPFPRYEGHDFCPRGGFEPYVHVLGNRGCVRRCLFCSENRLWRGFRARSPERVVAELCHHVAQHHLRFVEFVDLLVNADLRRLERLCDLLIEADLGLELNGNLIVHKAMDAAMFAKLRRAGFHNCMVGLESGSETVLRTMHKGFRPEQASGFVRHAAEAGIRVFANFIVGYPSETEADFQESLRFLTDHHRYLDRIGVLDTCILYKGTQLYGQRERLGVSVDWDHETQGEVVHWRSPAAGDQVERFERFLRFVAKAEELELLLPIQAAAQAGNVERCLGFGSLTPQERGGREASAAEALGRLGWTLTAEEAGAGRWLLVHSLLTGSPFERDVALRHLLLTYRPEDAVLVDLVFGERLGPLDDCQSSTKELLLLFTRRHGRSIAPHLLTLLACTDRYLRCLAAKCLARLDFSFIPAYLSGLLREPSWSTLPAEVRHLFASERAAFHAWERGDSAAFLAAAAKLEVMWSPVEVKLREALRSCEEPVRCLEACAARGELPSWLHPETLADILPHYLAGTFDTSPVRSALESLLAAAATNPCHRVRSVLDRVLDERVRASSGAVPPAEVLAEELTGAGHGAAAWCAGELLEAWWRVAHGDAEEARAWFSWLVERYEPSWHYLFLAAVEALTGRPEARRDADLENLRLWPARFGQACVPTLVALLHVEDRYVRFVATATLLDLDVRHARTHLASQLEGESYSGHELEVRCGLAPWRRRHQAWKNLEPAGYLGGVLAPGTRFEVEEGAGGARPSWLLEAFSRGDEAVREFCLEWLLERAPGSSLLLELLREEHGPLPWLHPETLDLLATRPSLLTDPTAAKTVLAGCEVVLACPYFPPPPVTPSIRALPLDLTPSQRRRLAGLGVRSGDAPRLQALAYGWSEGDREQRRTCLVALLRLDESAADTVLLAIFQRRSAELEELGPELLAGLASLLGARAAGREGFLRGLLGAGHEHVRLLAAKLLARSSFDACLVYVSPLLEDEVFSLQPLSARCALLPEKLRHERFLAGDVRAFATLLRDPARPSEKARAEAARRLYGALLDAVPDPVVRDGLALALDGPPEVGECWVRGVLLQVLEGRQFLLAAAVLRGDLVPLHALHEETLQLIVTVYRRKPGLTDSLLVGVLPVFRAFSERLLLPAEVEPYRDRGGSADLGQLRADLTEACPALAPQLGPLSARELRVLAAVVLRGDQRALVAAIRGWRPGSASALATLFLPEVLPGSRPPFSVGLWAQFVHMTEQYGRASFEFLLPALACSDANCRFVAARCLLSLAPHVCVTHLEGLLGDPGFDSQPTTMQCAFFEAKLLREAWYEGHIERYLELTDEQGYGSGGACPLFLLERFQGLDSFGREVWVRHLLLQGNAADLVPLLEAGPDPLPYLQPPTLNLLRNVLDRTPAMTRRYWPALRKAFDRVVRNPYYVDEARGQAGQREVEHLLAAPAGSIPGGCEVFLAGLDPARRALVAGLFAGPDLRHDACLAELLSRFEPRLGQFYTALCAEEFTPLTFLSDETRFLLLELCEVHGRALREPCERLLHCSDHFLRFVAMKALAGLGFDLVLIHQWDLLQDEAFAAQPELARLGFYPEKRLFDAWRAGDWGFFCQLEALPLVERQARTEAMVERLRRAGLAIEVPELELLFLGQALSGDPCARECCLRCLLLGKGPEVPSDPTAALVLQEVLEPLPAELHPSTRALLGARPGSGPEEVAP